MSMTGKAALVTGGGTGVGRAVALKLAERGVNVAVNYSRSATEAAATVADIEALGVDGVAIQADVASDASVKAMVEQVVAVFGRLDVVVNSAGTTAFVPHEDLDGIRIASLTHRTVTDALHQLARGVLALAGDENAARENHPKENG